MGVFFAEDVAGPVDIRVQQCAILCLVQAAFYPLPGKLDLLGAFLTIGRDRVPIQQAGPGGIALLPDHDRDLEFCRDNLQDPDEFRVGDGNKVLVVLLPHRGFLLLPFIVAYDDCVYPVVLCVPAEEPGALVEEIPQERFPFSGKGIHLPAVFFGMLAVLSLRAAGKELCPLLVKPLVEGLDGPAPDHKGDGPEVVANSQEVPHTGVQAKEPYRVFRKGDFFRLAIKGHKEAVSPICRLNLCFYVL